MQTEKTNSENLKHADWPVFHEYSNNKPNMPFISITSSVDGKRFVIGRIKREYDNDKQKAIYTATDGLGNVIFADIPDLVSIKKEFVNQRENLSRLILDDRAQQKDARPVQKENTAEELKSFREHIRDRNKNKEIER